MQHLTSFMRGGEEAIFELNGKVVNRIGKMTCEVDGKPLTSGEKRYLTPLNSEGFVASATG